MDLMQAKCMWAGQVDRLGEMLRRELCGIDVAFVRSGLNRPCVLYPMKA